MQWNNMHCMQVTWLYTGESSSGIIIIITIILDGSSQPLKTTPLENNCIVFCGGIEQRNHTQLVDTLTSVSFQNTESYIAPLLLVPCSSICGYVPYVCSSGWLAGWLLKLPTVMLGKFTEYLSMQTRRQYALHAAWKKNQKTHPIPNLPIPVCMYVRMYLLKNNNITNIEKAEPLYWLMLPIYIASLALIVRTRNGMVCKLSAT